MALRLEAALHDLGTNYIPTNLDYTIISTCQQLMKPNTLKENPKMENYSKTPLFQIGNVSCDPLGHL